MTDFRAKGTIMGPAGLTAVFGMGTGVAPPVWSPESRRGGGQAAPAGQSRCLGHVKPLQACRVAARFEFPTTRARGPFLVRGLRR